MQQLARKGLWVAVASGAFAAAAGGVAHADSGADGAAADSPGVLSGNAVQVPVSAPLQLCGNSISVVGALNPAFGNSCTTDSGPAARPPVAAVSSTPPATPKPREMPPTVVPRSEQATSVRQATPKAPEEHNAPGPRLAETGTDMATMALVPLGLAFMAGGTVLYRRTQAARI